MNIFKLATEQFCNVMTMMALMVALILIVVLTITSEKKRDRVIEKLEQKMEAPLEDRTIIIDRTDGKTNTMSITYSNRITGKIRGWHTMFYE